MPGRRVVRFVKSAMRPSIVPKFVHLPLPPEEKLHERFAGLLHRAKRAPPGADLGRRMEREVIAIAPGYRPLGEGKPAARLENAAPCLFTLVMQRQDSKDCPKIVIGGVLHEPTRTTIVPYPCKWT